MFLTEQNEKIVNFPFQILNTLNSFTLAKRIKNMNVN